MDFDTGFKIVTSLLTPPAPDDGGEPTGFSLAQDAPASTGTSPSSSGSLVSLPQDGGEAQTLNEILGQVEQTGGSRSEALFGDMRVRDESGNLVDPINLGDYAEGSYVPEGRDEWLRQNDQQAIAGLRALVDSGKIGPNTVVVVDHGHGPEIVRTLTGDPRLRAEAEFVHAYRTGAGASEDKADALPSMDQMETYLDSTLENQERNGKGGAVVLAADVHGSAPDPSTLPSPEELRRVMGPDVNIVFVDEQRTGTEFDPTAAGGRYSEWLRQAEEAGIPVDGYGINSRSKPGGGPPSPGGGPGGGFNIRI